MSSPHIVHESITIRAPIDRCWRGWKFGLLTEHHTLITAFEPPHSADGQRMAFFDDSQERGHFAAFDHEHLFRELGEATELEDRIHFSLPFGPLGMLVATLLIAPTCASSRGDVSLLSNDWSKAMAGESGSQNLRHKSEHLTLCEVRDEGCRST